MIDIPDRVEFLKKSHLFRGLKDEELTLVANGLQEKTCDIEEVVFTTGANADSFFIVYQGCVNQTRRVNNKEENISSSTKGEYFGETGLLKGTKRSTTANAQAGTVLLILHRLTLVKLISKVPGLKRNLVCMLESRSLVGKLRYNWLDESETILFLAHKHWLMMLSAMLLPAFFLIPIFGLLSLAFLWNSSAFGALGGAAFVIDVAWGIWRYVDWGNDFYIVTNQRVIWLEKIVALYDSRTEAAMTTILSVGTEEDYLGRLFDYGSVVVRTFTGQIRMDFVVHPQHAAAMIEEYMKRSKETKRVTDVNIMQKSIRNKLDGTAPEEPSPQLPVPARLTKQPISYKEWWKNAFKMRVENGDVVTYHKHIITLFRDEFLYLLGIFLLFISVPIWPLVTGEMMPLWTASFVAVGLLVLFGLVVYEYLDWANDIYQVTPEQIIDVYKKPLGQEDRRTAPLENILSTENKRNGIIEVLFNYGTVYINVGGANFDFEDILDPPSVQQDIIRRQQGKLQKKVETEIATESERMTDWLATYHRTLEEIDREKNRFSATDSE